MRATRRKNGKEKARERRRRRRSQAGSPDSPNLWARLCVASSTRAAELSFTTCTFAFLPRQKRLQRLKKKAPSPQAEARVLKKLRTDCIEARWLQQGVPATRESRW